MAALFGLARRNWQISNPPEVPKTERPLRFGILGAADIGPLAIIVPARTHSDVVVQAVAARSQDKAKAYARKHGIPEVKPTYQDVIDDPKIDCVYIPLPNGLHYEWALRALKAGKHVLLEKPENLFRNSLVIGPTSPVIVEAAHYLFHPAWSEFMTYITPTEVVSAKAVLWVPMWHFATDDIRYRYELAGGAMMDLGSYTASALVRIFGNVAEACEECVTEAGSLDVRCDRSYKARYRFSGGVYGEMEGDLRAPLNRISPDINVVHRPVVVSAAEAGVEITDGQELVRTRKVKFANFVQPAYLHSIQVDDEFKIRKIGDETNVVKRWKKSKSVTSYSFREVSIDQVGEPYWATYRYQLEQFVNRVRGRQATQWVEHDASVTTVQMLDMAYTAAKLPLRLTSEYK
ncbi:hypothetical protein BJ170DRAFT_716844 [Xylariales sp. AK1849]|nr:hypothetical protein BJ170DRAFT_716844 [Xylariales sp. AK1849]